MSPTVVSTIGYGHVVPLQNPLQGCPHSLTATQTHSLIQMVQNTPDMYLDELQDWLALEHDIMVSQMTLHHIIQDAELSYKLLRWCAMEWCEVCLRYFYQKPVCNGLYADSL